MHANDPNSIDNLLTELDAELDQTFEARLREALEGRDRAWLVEELTRLVLRDRHLANQPQRQLSRQAQHVEPLADRRQRLDRIRALGLDPEALRATVQHYRSLTRDRLEAEGYLVDAPHKGKEALTSRHRSDTGASLLQEAEDLFYALLYCDAGQGVQLERNHRDFLTVTLPKAKASSLERFMLAVTEMPAAGTWLDPEGVSDDIEARNTLLQVEYGDSADNLVSDGLVAALGLINNLEVNEEILYARMEQIERSTLVS